MIICKRKGDSYEMKEFINLHNYQVRDDSLGDRENKKVSLGGGGMRRGSGGSPHLANIAQAFMHT